MRLRGLKCAIHFCDLGFRLKCFSSNIITRKKCFQQHNTKSKCQVQYIIFRDHRFTRCLSTYSRNPITCLRFIGFCVLFLKSFLLFELKSAILRSLILWIGASIAKLSYTIISFPKKFPPLRYMHNRPAAHALAVDRTTVHVVMKQTFLPWNTMKLKSQQK